MPTKLQTIRTLGYPENHKKEKELITLATQAFRLSKDHWNELTLPLVLDWTVEKFETISKASIPDNKRGVYSFVIEPGIANHPRCSYLVYVGMVEKDGRSFKKRFNEYLNDQKGLKTRRLNIHDLLSRWEGHIWFCYAPVADSTLIATIEEALIDAFIPPFNKRFTGKIQGAMKMFGSA
jgi:hypothetical protein